jgi:hypothetical protein
MPVWLPVFASAQVPHGTMYITDHGWTVVWPGGQVEQMPAGVYVSVVERPERVQS